MPAQEKCERNLDCSVNAACAQEAYDAWCATEGALGACPPVICAVSSSMSRVTKVCVPIGDVGKYSAYCAAHGGAASQCPPDFCKEEYLPKPKPEPETACLPTNYAYRLYCADQSAAGSCPSPWCEMGVAALQASRARQASSRRHNFLGTVLIQECASLERRPATSSVEGQAEL